ncbi:MAG: MBL fold metallo-hydrolase [Gemmatimonadota bacterium]|nr:MAG: MBL fold metallo-hydrolase [Gemmatimonadota bacterium]
MVLGSGTLVPSGTRRSAGHLVTYDSTHVLMDCGSGTMHGMARWGAAWDQISHILLTHFHTDHISNLAPLLAALNYGSSPRRTAPLTILGPQGLHRLMDRLVDAFGEYVLAPGFPLEVLELERDSVWSDESCGVGVSTHPTRHTASSVAYRLDTDAGAVCYTGDTGPRAGLGKFFEGTEVLIAECSYPDRLGVETHLTPSGLATLAEEASPGLLVVTHIYADLEPEAVPGLLAQAGYGGRVRVAEDGLVVNLAGGEGHPQ